MHESTAKRADFWTGLFWIAFGATVVVLSALMPVPTHLGATVLTGPGLVPGLLGWALIVLGIVLAVRSRRGKTILPAGEEGLDPRGFSVGRPIVALVLMVVYAVSLALRQPFVPWTIGFVTIFVVAFNWSGRDVPGRTKLVAGAFVLAAATALIVEFVFEKLFFVRLP